MPRSLTNIHDKFVKELLADKERAIAFLEGLLPDDLVRLIAFESLSYLNTSYLYQQLKASYADMVWRVELKDQQTLQICLLLEHKSYPDPLMGFQLLEYIALAYQAQRKEGKPFEVIVPALYYHGSTRWDYTPPRTHLTHYPTALHDYVPDFETIFIDLHKLQVPQLERLRHGLVRSALTAQRYYTDYEEITDK